MGRGIMAHGRYKSTMAQLVVFATIVFVFGCSAPSVVSQEKRSQSQTIKVEDILTFEVPGGWSRSTDNASNFRHEWRNAETKLVYLIGDTDSGSYDKRIQPWMNDYQENTTRIGGQKAVIRSFSFIKDAKQKYVAELNIGNWDKNQIQFFMRVEGSNAAIVDLAKEIFTSIRMSLPAPERSTPH